MKPRFIMAFILLSLATIALLGFSIQFFTSPPVWMQMNAWVRQTLPSPVIGQNARAGLSQQSFVPLPTLEAPTPLPTSLPLQPLRPEPSVLQARLDLEQEPARTEPTPLPVTRVIEISPPAGSLVIPALGINQPLVPVAVREQEWDVSNLGTQVGWLQTTGAYPGDDRAMVLIGHITLPYPGGSGPFLNLSALQSGEIVEYRIEQITYVYQVKGQAVVSPDKVESLYQSDGNSLLLVTCTGYNVLEQQYDRRLFVEAVLVRVENGTSLHNDPLK